MKWIKSITAVILMILLIFVLDHAYNSSDNSISESNSIVDSVIFPHDEVIEVNIEIDEGAYAEMISNATSEEIVMADITYNGNTYENVGIRPKGNSSLRDVSNSDGDRYSYKIDFNYYVDDQSLYGITKLNLNNIFNDSSMMAEYLSYEMLDELDAVSSRTTYVNLSINGEVFGLYLAVEQVNEQFLTENYGDSSGELYKPDSGIGANLAYISDNGEDYTGMFPENMDSSDNEDLATLIKTIEDNGDLDSVMNVDSFLKYLAVSTMTIHQDSYQGGMFHNYYLYNNNGVFEWISWDLNMTFNGFPGSGMTDTQAISYLIDEPVSGAMEKYPLIEAIFQNEEYVEKYHEYLKILSNGYLQSDTFNEKVLSVYKMIKSYVEADPTSFYSYEEFENGLFNEDGTSLGILSFMEQRVSNVAQQLSGEITSTNNGEGNAESSKGGGMKGEMGGENAQQAVTYNNPQQPPADTTEQTANGNFQKSRPPMNGQADGDTQRTPPDGMTGQMPQDSAQRTPPDGMAGQMPDGNMQQQVPNNSISNQQTTNESTQSNSSDFIVLIILAGLLTAFGFFLKRKH